MALKLKLTTTVEVTARAEITVEADSIEDVDIRLEAILNDLDKRDAEALKEFNKDPMHSKYPERLITWTVDQDDVENEVNNKLVEIDEYEEVQT